MPGRWDDTLDIARRAFELSERNGAVGCRLSELDHAGQHSGLLCAVIEYNSMRDFGTAGDAWIADEAGRALTQRMRTDSPFEPVSSGLYTEVAIF